MRIKNPRAWQMPDEDDNSDTATVVSLSPLPQELPGRTATPWHSQLGDGHTDFIGDARRFAAEVLDVTNLMALHLLVIVPALYLEFLDRISGGGVGYVFWILFTRHEETE